MRTPKQKPEIQSAAIYRVTDKATGKTLGYLVPSDTHAGTFYEVTWDEQSQSWRCKCPANKPCKHERAVREVEVARYHARVAAKQREDIKHREQEERREMAALNGNRAFSLMR